MALDYIQDPSSTTYTTPVCDADEGWPGAPAGIDVAGRFDVTGDREKRQALGINYLEDGSQATPWAAGVALYNEYCRVLYTAARRLKRLESILGPSGAVTGWTDNDNFAEEFTATAKLLTYTGARSYGTSFHISTWTSGNDPRGYANGGYETTDRNCLVPGMRFRVFDSTDATVLLVEGEILDIGYADGTCFVFTNKTLPATADTMIIVHDLLPLPWQAWPLYQNIDGICQNCMPAWGDYIRTIKSDALPLTAVIAGSGDEWSYCGRVNDLELLDSPESRAAFAAYEVHCKNVLCPLYDLTHQHKPSAQWFNSMMMGRGLVDMLDSSTPRLHHWSRGRWNEPSYRDFAGSVGINGILRYLGLYLGYPFIWSTMDMEAPPGHNVSFPFLSPSYWLVDWAEGSDTPFFATWLDMARAAGSDNVGIVAAMAAAPAYVKHSPDGGTGGAGDVLADADPATAFEKAIGIRRSGYSGNFHADSAAGGGEDGVQRVRPRRVRSLRFTFSPAEENVTGDDYSTVTAKVDGSVDMALGCFQRAVDNNKINVKKFCFIDTAAIVGGFLEIYFALTSDYAQVQDAGGGPGDTVSCYTGGNVVQQQQHMIYDNPGASFDSYRRGDMQAGLSRGDVIVIPYDGHSYHLLCVEAQAYYGYQGTPSTELAIAEMPGLTPGAGKFPTATKYVHAARMDHSAQEDWGKFLLVGEDGAAVTAIVDSLHDVNCTIQSSAILPNPTYYPPLLTWCPDVGERVSLSETDHLVDSDGNALLDSDGNTLTFVGATTTTDVTVDPGRGVLHIPASYGLTGSGHLFFEGHVFCRNQNRQMEQAHNLNQAITNVCLGYYDLRISLTGGIAALQEFLLDRETGWLSPLNRHFFSWGSDAQLTGSTDGGETPALVNGHGSNLAPGETVWKVPDSGSGMVGYGIACSDYIFYEDTPVPRWWAPSGSWMITEEIASAFLIVFSAHSIPLRHDEFSKWYITVRIKNGLSYYTHGHKVYHPYESGLSAVDDDITDDESTSEVWYEVDDPTPIAAGSLNFVQLYEETIDGQTYYSTTELGDVDMSAGGSFTLYGDTYTDYLVDVTDTMRTVLESVTENPGYLIGMRLKLPSANTPWQKFENIGIIGEGVDKPSYKFTYQYTYNTFSGMDVIGQYVQIDATKLAAGSAFHFGPDGHQAHGPCWIRPV